MPPQTKLVQPKTRRGRRILEARAPKLIEDAKRVLILQGTKTSPAIKSVLTDLHKLKGQDSARLTRKNEVHPLEAGGEAFLERHARRVDASLLAFGSHSKKRPDNLVLGRFFDGALLDAVEVGVQGYRGIADFARGGAARAAVGNKPAIAFAGEAFASDPDLARLRSILLDLFRGPEVANLNLAGLDRVVVAVAEPSQANAAATANGGTAASSSAPYSTITSSSSSSSLSRPRVVLLRSYAIRYKKSGGPVPRVALEPSGPCSRLVLRRVRVPPVDLEREAMRQPRLARKKDKNERTDSLEGRVAKVYVPKQRVEELALHKPKGIKRDRREAVAAAREEANQAKKKTKQDA